MDRTKYFISFLFVLISCAIYSQKGFYVQKDFRIKKYQKDIIEFLIEKKELTQLQNKLKIDDYSGKIGVVKCIEVYDNKSDNDILLVRFFSLSAHSQSYWGLLKSRDKYLFSYNKEDESDKYLEKLDQKKAKIILEYLKIYSDWDQ